MEFFQIGPEIQST